MYLPKVFPLRGRWPPEGRSDEVLLRLAVHCPHQSATPTASPRGGSLGLARIAPPHLRRDPTKWSRRIRKNEEADTEFSRLRGNGVQRVHSDAASGSRATAVVRPFGAARHTPPRPPDASLTCGWIRKNGEADTELPPLRGESAVERARSDVGYHIFGWNCSTKRKLFLKSVQNPGFSAKLRKKRRTSLHNNINQGKIDAAGRDCKTLS